MGRDRLCHALSAVGMRLCGYAVCRNSCVPRAACQTKRACAVCSVLHESYLCRMWYAKQSSHIPHLLCHTQVHLNMHIMQDQPADMMHRAHICHSAAGHIWSKHMSQTCRAHAMCAHVHKQHVSSAVRTGIMREKRGSCAAGAGREMP